jgi:hypothetical protein
MTLVDFISYALLDSYQALAMTADFSNCGRNGRLLAP